MTETLTPRAALWSLALTAIASPAAAQGSWAFAPAAYTHDPQTGARVAQYAAHEPVEGLPDPRQTVSRYWRTRTNLRGADGSQDTIYEVRSFGNTLGGFDAQRERGYDASLRTLRSLEPFRRNPYLFFGGLQGFGYGFPGYPGAVPGTPVPAPQGALQTPYPPTAPQQQPGVPTADCPTGDCAPAAAVAPVPAVQYPAPGQPGTAYPYAPPSSFVAPYPPYAFGPYPYGGGFYPPYGGVYPPHGGGYQPPWWGYGPGRQSYIRGR